MALKLLHTQEDVTIRVCNVIIDSVSMEFIVEIENEDTFFDKVDTRDLITVVMENFTHDTTLESMELIKLRNTSLVFDANKNILLQLNQRTKHINDLRRVHHTETSESECMAKMLGFIQEDRSEDFEDKVAKWKARTVNNNLACCKTFSVDRDNIICDRNNHNREKAKDSGFHSANSTKEN